MFLNITEYLSGTRAASILGRWAHSLRKYDLTANKGTSFAALGLTREYLATPAACRAFLSPRIPLFDYDVDREVYTSLLPLEKDKKSIAAAAQANSMTSLTTL